MNCAENHPAASVNFIITSKKNKNVPVRVPPVNIRYSLGRSGHDIFGCQGRIRYPPGMHERSLLPQEQNHRSDQGRAERWGLQTWWHLSASCTLKPNIDWYRSSRKCFLTTRKQIFHFLQVEYLLQKIPLWFYFSSSTAELPLADIFVKYFW